MATPATLVPIAVKAPTTEELTREIFQVQAAEGGKVQIITIYFDGTNHVCWYLPLHGFNVWAGG